ncbi:MAG: hypothetical protein IKN74_05610 [Clostridia bacterium]|nr:hypothetical protein [Clostridia bacterium]
MILDNLPLIMLRCLLLTIIIELILALILGIRDKKDIINVILVNVITNPIVVLTPIIIYLNYGSTIRRVSLYILEVLTVIVEGLIYKKVLNYKKINCFLLSLILNVASFLIGEVINYFV